MLVSAYIAFKSVELEERAHHVVSALAVLVISAFARGYAAPRVLFCAICVAGACAAHLLWMRSRELPLKFPWPIAPLYLGFSMVAEVGMHYLFKRATIQLPDEAKRQ